MSDPDMGNWSYTYDANGNLARQTDALGQVITYTYDALNRLTGKSYSDGSLPVTYLYDEGSYARGRRTGMLDGSGSTNWDYDELGQVLTETKALTGTGTYQTGFSYDRLGRVETMTYPDGEVVTYTYNDQGLVDRLSTSLTTTAYLEQAQYTALDQPDLLTLGNGVNADYSYRDSGLPDFRLGSLVTSGPGGTFQELSYQYYDNGHVKNIVDAAQDITTWIYNYDPLDRLTGATRTSAVDPLQTYHYDYDLLHNLTARLENGPFSDQSLTLSYPSSGQSQPHAVQEVRDGANNLLADFSYDANGNRAAKTTPAGNVTYEYDLENRLTEVISGTATTTYVYDGDGRRVKRIAPDGQETLYLGEHMEIRLNNALINVSNGTGVPATNTCLTLDPAGTPYFVWDNSDDIYAGQLGGTPGKVYDSSLVSEAPQVAIDANGTVHVVWVERLDRYAIYYAYQTAGSSSWSAPINISAQLPEHNQLPAIVVATDNTVHVVWSAYPPSGSNQHLYHRSLQNGQWSSLVDLSAGLSGWSWRPDLAAGPEGEIHVVWQRTTSISTLYTKGDIYYRRWNGSGWDIEEKLSDSSVQSILPSVAVDGVGTVHVAWHYEEGNLPGTYNRKEYRYKLRGQSTWSEIEQLIDNTGLHNVYTDLAAGNEGDVYLTWSWIGYLTYAQRSVNGWSEPVYFRFSGSYLPGSDYWDVPCKTAYGPDYGLHVTAISPSWLSLNDDVVYTQLGRGETTKHYYASGQRIASRVHDEVYYTLNDPSGQSTTFVDSAGQQSWQILYDPLGNVISSTLPITLTESLAGHLDSTGLQFNSGRYYDPWVGSYVQPDPFGGAPGVPQSLNPFSAASGSVAAYGMTQSGEGGIPPLVVDVGKVTAKLNFLATINWGVQQAAGQSVSYGARRLAGYSLIRFSVSASRHKLLTRLPQEAIEILGGRSIVEGLAANRSIHTLSTGGFRWVRGRAWGRSAFDDFLRVIPGDARSTRWTGQVDDFFGHSFSWLGSRWFGAASAGVGDAAIQLFWPGTGDVWNYQEYGLTGWQVTGRVGVAAGGGLLAWGVIEASALAVGALIGAPVEIPLLVGVVAFVGLEYVYEQTAKQWLYEQFDLFGKNEPR